MFLFSVYKSEIQLKKEECLKPQQFKKKCAEFFFFNLQISKFFPVIIIQCGFLCCFILLEVDLHKTKMFWVCFFQNKRLVFFTVYPLKYIFKNAFALLAFDLALNVDIFTHLHKKYLM